MEQNLFCGLKPVRYSSSGNFYPQYVSRNRQHLAFNKNAFVPLREETSGSPIGIRTRERRAPIRQAIAWTLVLDFGLWTAASVLDTSLRLAAHEDHKFRAVARLRAQRLV